MHTHMLWAAIPIRAQRMILMCLCMKKNTSPKKKKKNKIKHLHFNRTSFIQFRKRNGSKIHCVCCTRAHAVCFQRLSSFFAAACVRVCCVKKDEKDAFHIKIRICVYVCVYAHNSKDILRAHTCKLCRFLFNAETI